MGVSLCQKCGDIGFPEALIYCDKCQIHAEHRYCLDKTPATFTEYVVWFCEDCEPIVANPCPKPVRKQVKRSMKSKAALKRKNAILLAARAKSRKHEYTNITCEKAESSERVESNKIKNDEKTAKSANSEIGHDQKVEVSEKTKAVHDQKIEESGYSQTSTCRNFEEAESNKNIENIKYDEKQGRIILEDNVNIYQEAEAELSKITINNYRADAIEEIIDGPALPIIDPTWRGRFNINDTKFSCMEGLAAHLSTKACLKVCEEARLLPKLLQSNMVHRDLVWPKSFRSSEPSDDHIALYFFPENEKDEKVYDSIVEYMIEDDLAMRADVVNAELLVFTSIQLPLEYWRFQAKYYLWGVFRRKQGASREERNDNAAAITAVSVVV